MKNKPRTEVCPYGQYRLQLVRLLFFSIQATVTKQTNSTTACRWGIWRWNPNLCVIRWFSRKEGKMKHESLWMKRVYLLALRRRSSWFWWDELILHPWLRNLRGAIANENSIFRKWKTTRLHSISYGALCAIEKRGKRSKLVFLLIHCLFEVKVGGKVLKRNHSFNRVTLTLFGWKRKRKGKKHNYMALGMTKWDGSVHLIHHFGGWGEVFGSVS